MAKTITLQYAATCRDCGAALEVGTKAKWYGRGRVYGIACHARPSAEFTPALRLTDAQAGNLACPTCKRPGALTPQQAHRGHQCDACADLDETAALILDETIAAPPERPGEALGIFYGSTRVGGTDELPDDRHDTHVFTETPAGYRARHRWARRHDDLNGAPEGDHDR
jgi:endogenous inhibitor of DNA gyrase (YacG/DUF329 family)